MNKLIDRAKELWYYIEGADRHWQAAWLVTFLVGVFTPMTLKAIAWGALIVLVAMIVATWIETS